MFADINKEMQEFFSNFHSWLNQPHYVSEQVSHVSVKLISGSPSLVEPIISRVSCLESN